MLCFPFPPEKFVVTEQSHQEETKIQINPILHSLDNSIKDQNTSVKKFLFVHSIFIATLSNAIKFMS